MTKTTGIWRTAANAGLAGLLVFCGTIAMIAQTAARATAKAQPMSGVPDNSGADAAGYAKLNAGQVDDAAAAFQAVLATRPNDAGALAGMGQVRVLQGNYLGAVSFLEQAKQANPNDASIAAALDGARFHFLMGEGKDAQTAKDPTDAEKRYREALELRPAAPDAVNALVNVLVVENKLSAAQDALSTAVAQTASASGHPPPELEMQLAQLDIATGQPQLAYPIFLQVLQENPGRVDAWSGLVSALHLMGHDADAVAQERAIPAATRGQLEGTPGFQQMMAGITSAPTRPVAAGEPVYAPFVPSAAPATVSTAPSVSPTAHVITNVPAAGTSQRVTLPAGTVSAKPIAPRPATAAAPKPVVSKGLQTGNSMTTQASEPRGPVRSAGSGAPLVTQPAARPAGRGDVIPDTGEQQYPQPKARPKTASSAN